MTADVSLAETAHAAEFFSADGVIVTGTATGAPALPGDVDEVAEACALPVFVGSGITPDNLVQYARARGYIVGSYVKEGGAWQNPLDPARVAALARAFEELPR